MTTEPAIELDRQRLAALGRQIFTFETLKRNFRKYIPGNIEISGKDLLVGDYYSCIINTFAGIKKLVFARRL